MAALSNTTEGKLSNMKDNLTQLKVAFGTGFNDGLRIALDAVNTKLPQLLAKFTEFGKLIGNTISDAVDGDFVRFFMIGSMIGEVIMEGINLTTKSQFLKLGQFVRREVFGGLAGEIEKYTKPEKMVQREEKDRKDRQFMQEYELGVFVSNMKFGTDGK
jgi:hypothetical protein